MFSNQQLIAKNRFGEIASARKYEETINLVFRQKAIAKWNSRKPKEKDFIGIYPDRLVYKAIEAIAIKSKTFDQKDKELGLLGENICLQGFFEEEWLKAVKNVLKTSEYDNLFRGTDMVFCFESEGSEPLYLAVDVKTYKNSMWAERVIENMQNAIVKGYMTNLRYFHDEDLGIKGPQSMPNIVLILDPRYALSIQNIMAIAPVNRTPDQKKEVDFLKNLMNAEIMAQVMEMDMFIDTIEPKSDDQLKIQKHYQAIIASIKKYGNFAAVEQYIEKLISMTESKRMEHPDLYRNYVHYREVFDRYDELKSTK